MTNMYNTGINEGQFDGQVTSNFNDQILDQNNTSEQTELNVVKNTTKEDTSKQVTFEELGLPQEIVKAVHDIGFTHATPIQQQAIPQLLAGKDILGLAQTGSGKTASFMLPLLSKLDTNDKSVQILVLSPTRELAIQVSKATEDFLKYIPRVKSLAVYGGQPFGGQIRSLKQGVQIVIATPGRLVDHLNRNNIDLSNLKAIVLDEADEMLNMGFHDDLETILSHINKSAQTALFSATMPKTIENLTKKYLDNPEIVRIKSSKVNEPRIEQFYWLVQGYKKEEALVRFLEVEEYDAAIVFVKTRQGCNELTEYLLKNNLPAACLHGDMSQEVRESTLNGLRNESINILIATDVAARGLDIDRLDLVVNFDLPQDNESYVHRIGRTGRAGREGRSISFVGERERFSLYNIELTAKKELKEIKAPTNQELETLRRNKFKKMLEAKLDDHNLENYTHLVEELIPEDYEPEQVIAALVNMATNDYRLVLPKEKPQKLYLTYNRNNFNRRGRNKNDRGNTRGNNFSSSEWDTYYLGIGREQNADVKQILNLVNRYSPKVSVGQIRISSKFTTIELPKDFGHISLDKMTKAQINGIPLNMRIFEVRGDNNGRGNYRNNNRNDRGDRNNRYERKDRNFNKRSSEDRFGSIGRKPYRKERNDRKFD